MFSRVSVFSRSAVRRVASVARPVPPTAARAAVPRTVRTASSLVSRPRVSFVAAPVHVARFSTRQNVLNVSRVTSEQKTEQSFNSRWSTGAKFLAGLAVAAGVSVITASADSKVDYDAVRKDIAALLEVENYDDGSYGPLFVRLAWHASGTYDKASNTGGSNGATMRFKPESSDGGNNGLALARDLLEKVKAKHPGITYADLWTLAGATAIEEMGGPKIPWRAGRSDSKESDPVPPNGRLPDASKKADHVRAVFYRMGFNDREIVALLGAHALGRCHTDRSGYEGPWTNAPTTFSNEYFRLLIEEKWTPRKWNGPLQFEDSTGKLMMTPADLAFIEDPEFRKVVEQYAKDEQLFFKDFAAAFGKLLELGVPFK